jgi:hypothetical protein
MKVTINKAKSRVVPLSSLGIKDTFRRAHPYAGDCDFLIVGQNTSLIVMHESGKLTDSSRQVMIYNILTGVLGSMSGSVDVIQTESELTING